MAQLMRMGWFRPMHAKTLPAQEIRALLTGRKLLLGKLRDVELGIRGLLRGFGLKVGQVSKGRYEARIRELVLGTRCWNRLRRRGGRRGRACEPNLASCTGCCCELCAMMRSVVA